MFKQSLLAFTCAGLISGSVFAHTTNPKQTVQDNIKTLRDSLNEDAEFYNQSAFLGCLTAFLGAFAPHYLNGCIFNKGYSWKWEKLTTEEQLQFYVDAAKNNKLVIVGSVVVFAAGSAFALYNSWKRNQIIKRANAIENIGTALSQESTENLKTV